MTLVLHLSAVTEKSLISLPSTIPKAEKASQVLFVTVELELVGRAFLHAHCSKLSFSVTLSGISVHINSGLFKFCHFYYQGHIDVPLAPVYMAPRFEAGF